MLKSGLLILWAGSAFAQPFVYYGGAVNAGSFLPAGLPNSAVAQGSMFSIFGRGLGPAIGQQVSAFPLQPAFAGVSIEIAQGAKKVQALPVFAAGSQLNAIMPSDAPLGVASLRVSYNGQTSNPIPIAITRSSVGVFSVNGGGFGPGIIQNYESASSQPINSLTATARPSQIEILWATGLGPASFSDGDAPTATTIEPSTEVYVGGKKAQVSYAGRSPCCASIDQIVFAVPVDAPAGCYVPVVVRTRGSVVSNTVTMAIHPSGAGCSDAHNPLNGQQAGGTSAVALLSRESIRADFEGPAYDAVLDSLVAAFRSSGPSPFFFSAVSAPPPAGACTVYAGTADRRGASPFGPPGAQVNPGATLTLEAGTTLSLSSNSGQAGTFIALLGGQSQLPSLGSPVLNGGAFTLSAPGSGAVQPFRVSLNSVSALTWTNRDQVTSVDRTKDLTLSWAAAPGASRGVMIAGQSTRRAFNALSAFVCFAGSASSFTIPAYVLAALPAADSDLAKISIGNVPVTAAQSLPGFDNSFVGVSNWVSKTVVIQ